MIILFMPYNGFNDIVTMLESILSGNPTTVLFCMTTSGYNVNASDYFSINLDGFSNSNLILDSNEIYKFIHDNNDLIPDKPFFKGRLCDLLNGNIIVNEFCCCSHVEWVNLIIYNDKQCLLSNDKQYLLSNFKVENPDLFILLNKPKIDTLLTRKNKKVELLSHLLTSDNVINDNTEIKLIFRCGGSYSLTFSLFKRFILKPHLKMHVRDKYISIQGSEYLAIHVRCTDWQTDYKSLYNDNIDLIHSYKYVYVATDNIDVVNFFKSKNLNVFNFTTFPGGSIPLHYSSINGDTIMKDLFCDIYICAMADKLLSNSTGGFTRLLSECNTNKDIIREMFEIYTLEDLKPHLSAK